MKRAMFEDEELTQISGEAADLRLRPVHADPFRPRFQEADLRRLVLRQMTEDVVHVERGAVYGGQPLGRIGDSVARDDFDLEPLVPAPRVRVLGKHPDGALQEVSEGEALLFEPLARQVRGEGDEHVNLRLVEVDTFGHGPHEDRFRVEAPADDPLGQEALQFTNDCAEANFLLFRGEDFLQNSSLDGIHRESEPNPAIKNSAGRRLGGQGRRPFRRAAAITPLITNCTAIAARRSPRIREIARVPVRPILRKIRSAYERAA